MKIAGKKIASGILVLMVLVSSFGAVAPRAHAQWAVIDPANLIENTWTAFVEGEYWLKEYVLDAILWVLIQQVIQSLTGSIVNWINGSNSGGFSVFVQNLPLHFLNVGDVQALSFFSEFAGSNSPFAATILSSLRTYYLQGTSGPGFWAANQCTLDRYSLDPNRFISGDFREGGWAAWLALTTQPQNNPYLLYSRVEAELAGRVLGGVNTHNAQLDWGSGLISWCGDTATASAVSQQTTTYLNAGSTSGYTFAPPPQTCTRPDGSSGSIVTPGAVIHDQLSKSLGTTFDKLVTADEINEILSALVQRLITEVMGNNGLASLSQTGSGNTRSLIDQIATDTSFLSSGPASALTKALDQKEDSIDTYRSAWQTIQSAAQTARTRLTTAASTCLSPYATSAQTAITNTVDPIISLATQAASVSASADATVSRLRADLASATTAAEISAVSTAIQNLQNLQPTSADAGQATIGATVTNSATAPSNVSLNVSGGTIIDQMNLLAANAQNALAVCALIVLPP